MLTQAEQILKKLVGFDTVSSKPNRACIDFMRDYLDGVGVKSEIIAGKEAGKACLWATVGAEGKRGVALAGHSDVVPVDGQNWTNDPFILTERDGKLFGRGAADMKGFIACALAFVPEFLAAKTGGCFHLAFTCDEETDMSGAMHMTDSLAARAIKPEWIWIGEPTGLSVVDEHKGVAAYRTHITGVPYHSSRTDKGLNAIELMTEFSNLVIEAARQKKEKPFANSRFTPPYSTINLGLIEGGTAENIVAEHCELVWQVRAHPGDYAQDVVDAVEEKARVVFASRPRAKMETCTCFDIPPFLASPHNPGAQKLTQALKCTETKAVGFATEAGIFQKLGAPAVVCGPGFIEQAHQPDEFIDKKQLVACVDLMRSVLLSSCAQGE